MNVLEQNFVRKYR